LQVRASACRRLPVCCLPATRQAGVADFQSARFGYCPIDSGCPGPCRLEVGDTAGWKPAAQPRGLRETLASSRQRRHKFSRPNAKTRRRKVAGKKFPSPNFSLHLCGSAALRLCGLALEFPAPASTPRTSFAKHPLWGQALNRRGKTQFSMISVQGNSRFQDPIAQRAHGTPLSLGH